MVTMVWWDDLWLNEAFASYVSSGLIGPILLADWDVWMPFQEGHVEKSMSLDATTSHPIITPITEESQLSTAFDMVTYDKGASGE